jgi:uncharacterized protein YjcR
MTARPRRTSPEQLRRELEARDLFLDGCPVGELAQYYAESVATIESWLRRHLFGRQPRRREEP